MNPSVGSESVGAILLQKDPKTLLMRPVYFVSRVMKPTELAYSEIEKMVLALMFATQRFRAHLLPRHFIVITMEENFPHVLQHMDVSARISKWIVQLQEFDYTVMVEESTRVALAGILTHQFPGRKEKKEDKHSPPPLPPLVKEVEQAFALYFDGAYKRTKYKALDIIVVYDPFVVKVFLETLVLNEVHSNNEAEYGGMILYLKWCLENSIY